MAKDKAVTAIRLKEAKNGRAQIEIFAQDVMLDKL